MSSVGVIYFFGREAVVVCSCWRQMFGEEEVVGVRAHDRPEIGRGARRGRHEDQARSIGIGSPFRSAVARRSAQLPFRAARPG